LIHRHVRIRCRWFLTVLTLLVGGGAANAADAAPLVLSVSVASGRHFTGQLDPRTDERQLWLRFERGGASIQRPIDWSNVLAVWHGGEQLSPERVRQMVDVAGKEPAKVAVALRVTSPAVSRDTPTAHHVERDGYGRAPDVRIRALSLHATLGNWDSDVELDGLAVAIFPLNQNGEISPVTGSLEVWLIGEMPQGYRGDRNPRLGYWHVQVRPEDFHAHRGVFTLPFQATHPEFDTELGPFGAVHARLTVPGQGTFETTVTTRVRPYSGFRDRLQQSAGRRFLPGEMHGRID
jgi:hypothetical protein